jgi:hypothetical protein
MAYLRTEILVPTGVRRKIAEKHSCTHQYVGKCLRYEAQSELADKIRKDAITNFFGQKTQIKV